MTVLDLVDFLCHVHVCYVYGDIIQVPSMLFPSSIHVDDMPSQLIEGFLIKFVPMEIKT